MFFYGLIFPLFLLKLGDTYNKYIEEGGEYDIKAAKIDVTDRVIGKMKNGEMELFLDNTSIGKIQLPG